MSKRAVPSIVMMLAMAIGIFSIALAGDKATEGKSPTPAAKTEMTKASAGKAALSKEAGHMQKMAANEIAVCGCGKVFVPDANTKYIEYDGKSFACCSDGCHAMAMKDPAAAAKMAEENTAKFMASVAEKK